MAAAAEQGEPAARVPAPAPPTPPPPLEQIWRRTSTGQLVVYERRPDGRLVAVGWSVPERDGEP